MATNNLKKNITFENSGDIDVDDIIAEILKNNNLEETMDDYFKKVNEGKTPWADTLYKLSRNLASGNISEKDFIFLIQDKLQISQQNTQKILEQVKEKILPLTRVLNDSEIIEDSPNEILMYNKVAEETPSINMPTPSTKTIPPNIKKTPAKNKNISNIKEITPQIKKSNAQDAYREPIE